MFLIKTLGEDGGVEGRKSGRERGGREEGSNDIPVMLLMIRAVHSGGRGGGQEGQLPPPGKLIFFSNIAFD